MGKNKIVEKIREIMHQKNIDAYIIKGTDPHQSEYLPAHWQQREWISGFTGSTGTIVICRDIAGLWTDSRYFIQAEEELKNSGIQLFKLIKAHTPEHLDWLKNNLTDGATVGYDAELMSVDDIRTMNNKLESKSIGLQPVEGVIDAIWTARPAMPDTKIFTLEDKFQGYPIDIKINNVRLKMLDKNADYYLITALDDIAWLLGVRGNDIEYNPVFISYCLIYRDKTILFINKNKVPAKVENYLLKNKVDIKPYGNITDEIKGLDENKTLLIDPQKTSQLLYDAIPKTVATIEGTSIVAEIKTQKNDSEIENIREAMALDGLALAKFFNWLDKNLNKISITETDIAKKLTHFRGENALCMGDSFPAIVGFKQNGAIVHYNAKEEKAAKISGNGILLIDSGGQYKGGTTDITRTVSIGKATEQQRKDYTLVLKGHIALATCIFPKGTTGIQLDILARKALWDNGMNYGHGTGHGVGYFLNVHEGPQGISPVASPSSTYQLKPGMLISNEPGLYREGEYGIRIENLIVVTENTVTEFDTFFSFETVSLFPFDINLIDKSLLNNQEIDWINKYHKKVFEKLSPKLKGEELDWLTAKALSL